MEYQFWGVNVKKVLFASLLYSLEFFFHIHPSIWSSYFQILMGVGLFLTNQSPTTFSFQFEMKMNYNDETIRSAILFKENWQYSSFGFLIYLIHNICSAFYCFHTSKLVHETDFLYEKCQKTKNVLTFFSNCKKLLNWWLSSMAFIQTLKQGKQVKWAKHFK